MRRGLFSSAVRQQCERRFARFESSASGGAQGQKARPKWYPRSKAEFWGMVLGASVFPITATIMAWNETQKMQAPELAPDFSDNKNVTMKPKQQLGGPFEMLDASTGKLINDKQIFEDHWTLLYFGFSKCAEVCPNNLAFLKEVLQECDKEYASSPDTAKEASRLQMVFLSVDYLRDTPSVVQKFVSKYGPRFRGLCGTKEQVEQATKVWRVYFSSVDETDEEKEAREGKGVEAPALDDTYQFDHSSAVYLVGPDGKMKDFFFREMGVQNAVDRIGVHLEDVYGFKDTRQ